MQVPFFRFEFDEQALAGIEECLRSGWLTTGPKTKEFEQTFVDHLAYDGELYAVALNSCTAALHLALEAIGLQKGEIVIVPSMTFAATAEVVRYFDAIPVFVDTDPETLNLSAEHLAHVIDGIVNNKPLPGIESPYAKIRAIIPVHYGGQPCDMEPISALADKHDIDIIEDAAHAFPAGWLNGDKLKYVGAGSSRVACYSFYANKTITTGEGGMAVTADKELADRMRVMSLHGMNKDAWKRFSASGSWDYQLVAPGFKYNFTDIAAAIGLSQISQAESFRKKRMAISLQYKSAFEGNDALDVLHWDKGKLHSHHLFVIKLRLENLSINRQEFIEALKSRGVMCSVHWRPLHMHPYYQETYGYQASDYPVAADVWQRIVSLPLFPSMTDEEISYVIKSVQDICSENNR
jgi:dTDP-4-amino-4,6-dideoxygalactose transaminase